MKPLTLALTSLGNRLRPLLWPAMLLLLAMAQCAGSGTTSLAAPNPPASRGVVASVADDRVSLSGAAEIGLVCSHADGIRDVVLDTSRTLRDLYVASFAETL